MSCFNCHEKVPLLFSYYNGRYFLNICNKEKCKKSVTSKTFDEYGSKLASEKRPKKKPRVAVKIEEESENKPMDIEHKHYDILSIPYYHNDIRDMYNNENYDQVYITEEPIQAVIEKNNKFEKEMRNQRKPFLLYMDSYDIPNSENVIYSDKPNKDLIVTKKSGNMIDLNSQYYFDIIKNLFALRLLSYLNESIDNKETREMYIQLYINENNLSNIGITIDDIIPYVLLNLIKNIFTIIYDNDDKYNILKYYDADSNEIRDQFPKAIWNLIFSLDIKDDLPVDSKFKKWINTIKKRNVLNNFESIDISFLKTIYYMIDNRTMISFDKDLLKDSVNKLLLLLLLESETKDEKKINKSKYDAYMSDQPQHFIEPYQYDYDKTSQETTWDYSDNINIFGNKNIIINSLRSLLYAFNEAKKDYENNQSKSKYDSNNVSSFMYFRCIGDINDIEAILKFQQIIMLCNSYKCNRCIFMSQNKHVSRYIFDLMVDRNVLNLEIWEKFKKSKDENIESAWKYWKHITFILHEYDIGDDIIKIAETQAVPYQKICYIFNYLVVEKMDHFLLKTEDDIKFRILLQNGFFKSPAGKSYYPIRETSIDKENIFPILQKNPNRLKGRMQFYLYYSYVSNYFELYEKSMDEKPDNYTEERIYFVIVLYAIYSLFRDILPYYAIRDNTTKYNPIHYASMVNFNHIKIIEVTDQIDDIYNYIQAIYNIFEEIHRAINKGKNKVTDYITDFEKRMDIMRIHTDPSSRRPGFIFDPNEMNVEK